MGKQRAKWRLIATTLAASLVLLLVSFAPASSPAAAAGGPNLASGRPAAASSQNGPYVAANVADGSVASYWESAGGSFPQWVQVDLGAATSVDQVVLRLPSGWE